MRVRTAVDNNNLCILYEFNLDELKPDKDGHCAVEWECSLEDLEAFIAEEREETQPQYGS